MPTGSSTSMIGLGMSIPSCANAIQNASVKKLKYLNQQRMENVAVRLVARIRFLPRLPCGRADSIWAAVKSIKIVAPTNAQYHGILYFITFWRDHLRLGDRLVYRIVGPTVCPAHVDPRLGGQVRQRMGQMAVRRGTGSFANAPIDGASGARLRSGTAHHLPALASFRRFHLLPVLNFLHSQIHHQIPHHSVFISVHQWL